VIKVMIGVSARAGE